MYGLDYKVNEHLTAQYHYGELQDIYRQQFVGLQANQPVGPDAGVRRCALAEK